MATGPALRKVTSHRSIHDGAWAEARDLTLVVEKLYHDDRQEECLKAANMLIDHWEKRVIAHADAEEEGLYQEILRENAHMEKDIHMLTRDHDLLRVIVNQINTELKQSDTVTKDIINQCHALLIVNEIHSRSEENKLLED
ncbi:MAG TPA: hemerythrin domain-containing protein [Bacillota bacterium]|nr:hemerythrin domain-containing protein [Bacillota bacterium]